MKTLLLLLLMCASAAGQAIYPQNTFDAAVSVNHPSLWLNFNDATTAFTDAISQDAFVNNEIVSLTVNTMPTAYTGSQTTGWSNVLRGVTLYAGSITAINVCYYTTPASGQTLTVFTTSTPTSGTIQTVTTMTVAAVSGCQTLTAPANFAAIPTTSGEGVGFYAASGIEPAKGIGGGSGSNGQGTAVPVVGGGVPGTGQSNSFGFTVVVSNSYTSGTVTTQQPGFDNTSNANYSAKFSYNGWSAAPNNTLGSTMEWNTPWTMMIHVDKMNWDKSATKYVLASKGDVSTGAGTNSNWQLYIQQNTGNVNESQVCFARNGYTAPVQVTQSWCTTKYVDMVPNTFNYNIILEDSGTGSNAAISMWINGYAIPLFETSATSNGFGAVTAAITSAGTGFTASVNFTSTGGGTNCVVTGTATESGGALNAITSLSSYGCTSAPTIMLTSPTGTGAVITATAYPMTMNSTAYPLMVAGYVSNGTYYGSGGTDTAQGALNIDEFAEFPSDIPVTAISNIFYETKFYQAFLYPGIRANPPAVIYESMGCGPDFSGIQTTAMIIGMAKVGLIRLLGLIDDDGNANGSNSVGLWRQLADQAGFADVPIGIGAGSFNPNTGGCPAATITAYNANTPQNPASYPTATTVIRTLYARYPTTPIDFLMTQAANGYNNFQLSAADGISSLTGLQLQAQNYANGGWVSDFNGNFYTTPAAYTSFFNNYGAGPVYTWGGTPDQGGPGIFTSRTANDPIYMVALNNADSDAISGWTNLHAAQVISPYFQGGATVALSGGTGYAATTMFTSTGGGPNCNISGIMAASGGVPATMETSWGITVSPTATYNGIGYGCAPASFTATGSGVNLTVSAVSLGTITVGDTLVGTGIPTGTRIVSQTSGTTGGVGVYVTSAVTTASAATITRQPTLVLTAPTGTGVTMTVTCGTSPSAYGGSNINQFTVFGSQWAQPSTPGYGVGPIFRWFQNSLIDPPTTGAPRPY